MKKNSKRHIVGVTGMTGAGKSHFVKNYALDKMPEPLIILDPKGEYKGKQFDGFGEFYAAVKRGKKLPARSVIRVHSDADGELTFMFSLKCGVPHTLVIEEAPLFCSAHTIHPDLKKIINFGSVSQISVLWTAQRAGAVSRDLTAQTFQFCTFVQREKNDLDALKNYTDRVSDIKLLPTREFITFGFLAGNNILSLEPDTRYTLNANTLKKL